MKVLIVAKTRRGGGACVGGLSQEGLSVRLVAHDADRNERAGMEYEVGELWEVEAARDPLVIPPHVENVIVCSARKVGRCTHPEEQIYQHFPPVEGGPGALFEGLLQRSPSGALYIAQRTGLPSRSTLFWIADQPLHRDGEGKRIRYRYMAQAGNSALTFVGFQEPRAVIPAGTLLRVSLAHWWRPKDRPDEELRCYAQLSGWFSDTRRAATPVAADARRLASTNGPQSLEPTLSLFTSATTDSQHGTAEDNPSAVSPALLSPETTAAAVSAPTPPPGDGLEPARQVLKQTFGFADFLPLQAEIISHLLHQRDALAIMPTGGGKSLCYQLPALLFDGLTVVVSPLIALMQDQVSQLRELEVPAAFLNSTLSLQEYVSVTGRVRHGSLKILYVAPETLLRPETLLLLEESRLACLAVDEAHCISEWGHDFRPEYRQLHAVRQRFSQAVCIALTATATPRVREDIRRLLGIAAAGEFLGSFNRPNLFLVVQPRRDGLAQTLAFLEQHRDQSGIIYCATRQRVDELSTELSARGWAALPYHAGLADDVRRRNQEQFVREDATIMVATVAFGMGINKSNVRFILHFNLPKDLESYYQEIGRAGRDGLPADCLLLHSRADAMTSQHLIDKGAAAERPGRQARLEAMIRYAEAANCRRMLLLAYFGEAASGNCGHCDQCQDASAPKEMTDITIPAQKFLSCVKRTGESFGRAYIIDILRGSRAKRILQNGHDHLSTYGIGRELSAEEWRDLARHLISQGLLDQDLQHGGLRLTAKAWTVLKGEKIQMARLAAPEAAAAPTAAQPEYDRELFQRLRQLRQELAVQAGLPSYIVFSDRALLEMATYLPQDEPQFLLVNGVGAAKLAHYGQRFLELIRAYCEPRQLLPRRTASSATAEPMRWVTLKRRFEEVGELFASGHSLDELQARYEVKRETILQHLDRYSETGGHLDANRLLALSALSPENRQQVLAAFDRLGLERLSPIYESLGGRIGYDELHLLRIYLRASTNLPKKVSAS